MSGNSFGEIFKITTFGESHGPALGVIIDGVPAGIGIDANFIQAELDRRRPGQSSVCTMRSEADQVEILSGVFEGVSTGTSIGMVIRNTDQRSRDYGNLATTFRPGHADFGYWKKYGIRDYRGGGRSSGRETAARVAAGAVAKLFLKELGVSIQAHAREIGGIRGTKVNFDEVERNIVRAADPMVADAMISAIRAAQKELDSVGGIVECRVTGAPAGWGEPVFDKLDAVLAHAVMSLGGIKGIEFGDGFAAVRRRGSENNDPMVPEENFKSNHAGGILGGLSTGAEIVFRAAVKPTSSIAAEQDTVDVEGNAVKLSVHGRHDPCLVPRMVPVIEAMTALVLADMALRQRSARR